MLVDLVAMNRGRYLGLLLQKFWRINKKTAKKLKYCPTEIETYSEVRNMHLLNAPKLLYHVDATFEVDVEFEKSYNSKWRSSVKQAQSWYFGARVWSDRRRQRQPGNNCQQVIYVNVVPCYSDYERRTDKQTDGQTDGVTSHNVKPT